MVRRPEWTFFQSRHADRQQAHEKMLYVVYHQWNANQEHNEISPHICLNGYHQNQHKQQMSVSVWGKGNPHTLSVGISVGTTTVENSIEASQKAKNRTTTWFSNSTAGYRSKKKMKMLIQKDTSNPMFTETLFTIAKIWKQFKSPSIDDWIKKLWNIYTRILLSHKKEWHFAICNSMDGPGEHYLEGDKSDRESKYYIIHMWDLKSYNKLVKTKKKETESHI